MTHINYGFVPVNHQDFDLENKPQLERLVGLAHQHNVKALLSIGGRRGSKAMSQIASTHENRTKFTDKVVGWLIELGLDGIDIVWEHPGKGALECNMIDYANDTDNYLLLLRQLRASLDNAFTTIRLASHESIDDGHKLLTAAVGTMPFFKNNAPLHDVSHFSAVLDWIFIMMYDTYVGRNVIGPNAPLQTSTQDGASSQSVAQAWVAWTSAHMPANQMVLGLPFYGYAAKPIDDVTRMKRLLVSGSPARPQGDVDDELKVAPCPRAKHAYSGVWKWKSLINTGVLLDERTPGGQWIKNWDQESQTPWLYHPETRHVISYDDPKSIALKVNFAMCKEARGVGIQDLSFDYYNAIDKKGQLLTVVNELVSDPGLACQNLNPIPAYQLIIRMLRTAVIKRGLATTAPLVIKNSTIQASVILSRQPVITRDATPFEQAYFDYREKLERQEAIGTPTDFYFKKGSVAERRWKNEEQARLDAMTNANVSLTEAVQQSQATWEEENESLVTSATKIEKLDRLTKADAENNIKSLDRALQRTLYLVVKKGETNPWQFPESAVENSEYLHEAAERTLKEKCGEDMDTWFVGRQPVGLYKQSPNRGQDNGIKTFFMKARIYAGEVKPSKEISDYAWLTKEELATKLSPEYYNQIKDSLGDL